MTRRFIYADKVGAGPEHPRKRWGLFTDELSPEEAEARYEQDPDRREDWFGIVLLEPGEERPRAYLQMSPRANGVELNRLGAHGSIEVASTWRAYRDPGVAQPEGGAGTAVFLSNVVRYVYPDGDRFFRRGEAIGMVAMEFRADGYAREDRSTRHGAGRPSDVETREFRDVDVSANWFPVPDFGEWDAFFHPESASGEPTGSGLGIIGRPQHE